jgi:hypothetical protein
MIAHHARPATMSPPVQATSVQTYQEKILCVLVPSFPRVRVSPSSVRRPYTGETVYGLMGC